MIWIHASRNRAKRPTARYQIREREKGTTYTRQMKGRKYDPEKKVDNPYSKTDI